MSDNIHVIAKLRRPVGVWHRNRPAEERLAEPSLVRLCVCRTEHDLYGGLVSSSGGVSAAVGGLLL